MCVCLSDIFVKKGYFYAYATAYICMPQYPVK